MSTCMMDRKLFVRNYFSESPKVLLKINFVICKMKMSHEFFSLLNIREALSLLDLANLYVTNLLSIFNFFSTKTTSLA